MTKQEFLPIILGSDENAYGTARLFAEKYAVKPLLVCAAQLYPTRGSRILQIKQIDRFDSEDVFPNALQGVLQHCKERYDKLLVVPCSDYYSAMLSKYSDVLSPYIANPLLPPALLEELDTKDRFYRLCEKYGLDFPKTLVCSAEERETILEGADMEFPIVVKPENSNAYDYLHCQFPGKNKVYYFNTKEDYLSLIRQMNTSGYRGKLIIQEFIPGGDDAMRVMNSYSDGDGNVRMMCLGQPILEEYGPKTLGNYAAIISRSDEEIYLRVKRFLEEIGYVGFSNIDMKFDRRTGKYMLFELNPRLGRSSFFVRAAGYNMMEFLTEDVVFGRREPCQFGRNIALWTAVPKRILTRYVKDKALLREALQLWRGGSMMRTMFCRADLHPVRLLRVIRLYLSHFHTYRLYYFDKEGGLDQTLDPTHAK